MLRWINVSSRFSFPCILLKCEELKYSFASKRLKLAAKKYINKRSARSRVRMKRARKSARGRANPQQIHPRLTRTRASEKNKMALITIISLRVCTNKDFCLAKQICQITFLRSEQLFSFNCIQVPRQSEQK